MVVLNPVEKLIALRKKYKISQKELSGDKISRSHLAMIETGKNKLNKNTAKIIVDNFNEIFTTRKIDYTITLKELLESKEKQIERLKDSFLLQLDEYDNLEAVISEIESYASEYDVRTKITLYQKIGDIFFEKENYHRAASFYLRIINDLIIIRDLKLLGQISLSLIRVYLQTENFMAAVDLENLIKSELENFLNPEKTIILYNLGLIHDSIKGHREALNYFIAVEKLIKDPEKIFDVKNYQALSYADLGSYEEAISIYRSLMLTYKDFVKKLMINDNLLYISKLQNDSQKMKFYYRKCKNLIRDQNDSSEFYFFGLEQAEFSIAEVALLINKKKDAVLFFKKVCEEKTSRNVTLKFKAIHSLLNLLSKKDLYYVKELEKVYFNLLSREKNLELGFDFISFYFKENLKKEQEVFLHKIKSYNEY